MTTIVIPEDTNTYGNVFGGRVMELIDKAAAIAAMRHCRHNIVTASVDSLDFIHPVKLGNIITLRAQVNASWGSSMEVGVKVRSENPLTGQLLHTCTAYLTAVAVGEDGRPARDSVPAIIARTKDDKRRVKDAEIRRTRRLERVASRKRRAGRGNVRP